MSDGTSTWTYTYDANGMRTKRTNGTTTYTYVYNGGQLMQMTVGTDVLTFTYDANGNPFTFTYNSDLYYYVTNVQGDVVMLINSAGIALASYSYDAWGNLITIDASGDSALSIATINPLRYRGYVYDNETELYYLQNRYYDPEIGRFLSADVVFDYDAGLQGFNLFAYCGNDPINRIDISGADSVSMDDATEDILEAKTLEGGGNISGLPAHGYTPPKGGGGITDLRYVGNTKVTFGHGGRHLNDTGLTVEQVNQSIANDVVGQPLPKNSSASYSICIGSVDLTYRAKLREENWIHIGTYFVTKE